MFTAEGWLMAHGDLSPVVTRVGHRTMSTAFGRSRATVMPPEADGLQPAYRVIPATRVSWPCCLWLAYSLARQYLLVART